MDQRRLAYERLIAPMEARLTRTIWGIVRDPADAQDALQDALTVMWRRWDRLQTHPNPEALILRICINSAYDTLRRQQRRQRWIGTENVAVDPTDPAPSALQSVAGAEAERRVRQALASLSPNQATAIVMHVVEDVPYEGVAVAMGCRAVTVRKHVARARARLRSLLTDLVPFDRSEEKTHA